MSQPSGDRIYHKDAVISFRTTDGQFGGLSNMAPGFPVLINGTRVRTVEALYQALRFPDLPEAQREIIEQKSPMTAKMVSRRFLEQTRLDWDQVKVPIMRWCLRLKLAQNWESFSRLLLATKDKAIVEDSRKDSFWGAMPKPGEQLEGRNVLGRLLMELRGKLIDDPNSLRSAPAPTFPLARLFNEDLRAEGSREVHATDTTKPDAATAEANAVVTAREIAPTSSMSSRYPKRLIEVDLPIKRISAHARREKSTRNGHISTLHIWWARRPLAACRAVLCAALWPDPADENCPAEFRVIAADLMHTWATENAARGSAESAATWTTIRQHTSAFALCNHPTTVRGALLDFIADFSNWDNSTAAEYLSTARMLTVAANWSLSRTHSAEQKELGWPGIDRWGDSVREFRRQAEEYPRPLVVDPFAGGGSIPLEALRVGADTFASDLNPVPVLLNKVVLEYIPKYGQVLADEVRKWGEWIKTEAEKELTEFFPRDADGAIPIAYLWARTIRCEGPGCGAEVPLIRSPWLVKKANRSVAFQLVPNPKAKRVDFQIIVGGRDGWTDQANPTLRVDTPRFDGTVKRGSATCPCCGYTTPVSRVRDQLSTRNGGANDARMTSVVFTRDNDTARQYRVGTESDMVAVKRSQEELAKRKARHRGAVSLVPDEPLPPSGSLGFRIQPYGMTKWGDLFSDRQLLVLTTLARLVREVGDKLAEAGCDRAFATAVQTTLAQVVNKQADYDTSLCTWHYHNREKINHTFGRQAIPIVWDFAEPVFFGSGSGSWPGLFDWTMQALENPFSLASVANVEQANAAAHPLPNDAAQAFVTDPPYYDAVPYSDLSDFFFVWFKRTLPAASHGGFDSQLTPKEGECIVDEPRGKDRAYFELTMKKAMTEGRRVLAPNGVGIVVFAHKSTAGWEAQLQAMIDAGWIVTGSWPIDTEMGTRLRAHESAALASSVHLVCRPRENLDGSAGADEIGEWRDVLQELPLRIHEWMPRLAEEGVVGADAIFACLGPALEIFSRYKRVERADGDQVSLREYLEHVWAAVSKEALSMVFAGADATGFEEDSRLTAMWLWTLNAGATDNENEADDEDQNDADEKPTKGKTQGGFALEYDAARKISQGLGVHLEDLRNLVEIAGETARLLPVSERTAHLFGKDQASSPLAPKGRKKDDQLKFDLFQELTTSPDVEGAWGEKAVTKPGETTLDRVHQSMILFAAGRGEALRRFLVDDGAGKDQRFWRLAQALSALYPKASEEKRWIDGVLARKKGLGL